MPYILRGFYGVHSFVEFEQDTGGRALLTLIEISRWADRLRSDYNIFESCGRLLKYPNYCLGSAS